MRDMIRREIALTLMMCCAAFCVVLMPGRTLAESIPVTAKDCVTVRYVKGVWLSTSGKKLAYLIKSPNIATNRNDYDLYARTLSDGEISQGKLLLTGIELSDVQWLGDDNHLAVLVSEGDVKKVVIVDSSTGERDESLVTADSIDSFSMDATADTVAYSVSERSKAAPSVPTKEMNEGGYRVNLSETLADDYPIKVVYVRHRTVGKEWTQPQAVSVVNPFTHQSSVRLHYPQILSLSPDGKQLFVGYFANGIPEEWKLNPFVKYVGSMNPLLQIMVLYNVEKETTSLAFKNIYPYSKPVWSSDSQSFFVNAHSPVGSPWEADDIRDHLTTSSDVNMFQVYTHSGQITEVLRHVPDVNYHDGPLFVIGDSDVVVRSSVDSVVRLHRNGSTWHEVGSLSLPRKPEERLYDLVSDGTTIVGVHETVTTPENLFSYRQGQSGLRILTDLNPQLAALRFASVTTTTWKTPSGMDVNGLLFLPPNYQQGKRYPLVIQTKPDGGWFTCDSGPNHDPSFAPQPIASAGMLYLIRTIPDGYDVQTEIVKRPKGYPGSIGEAVLQMDIWDSAVEALAKRGMVDSTKVGIIGFSRTGWQVEFDLVNARTRYAAAAAADNVQYSLSEYWLSPLLQAEEERMYGGPPYGKTLINWLKYSISFNLERVQTPLLMEEMGDGKHVHDDLKGAIPFSLATRYEITTGLDRLGKPVEMYYYPDEEHQPDHPLARLNSLQRNVDWFRFWLQDYERPEDTLRPQYVRWHHLRDLHAQDPEERDGHGPAGKE